MILAFYRRQWLDAVLVVVKHWVIQLGTRAQFLVSERPRFESQFFHINCVALGELLNHLVPQFLHL